MNKRTKANRKLGLSCLESHVEGPRGRTNEVVRNCEKLVKGVNVDSSNQKKKKYPGNGTPFFQQIRG